jgi:ABC-2 type transport system permease protein
MLGLIAASQVTSIRAEEADGHLENLVVRPVSRGRWLAGRLLLSAGLLCVAGIVSGIGAWAGAESQHGRVGLGSLLAAGINVIPPALLLLGLGTLLLGAWPRRAPAAVYAYLAWSFLIEFVGAIVHASHWLLDTSVFFHLAPAPAVTPDWASAAAMTGLGVAAALVGGTLFRRRDLLGA